MRVEITGLTKTYSNSVHALQDIHLTIGKGMFGLLGPNGAGKTTLMQILATLQPASKGTVKIGSFVLGRDDQEIRRTIGYLPQEFGIYRKLSGYEYLDYVALMKGISDRKQRKEEVGELLEKVNLTGKASKKIGSYSGGMKQRIGIAQALLGSPQLLIVDEPTAGLDPEERIRFRDLLGQWGKERIVMLSTHIVSDIESSCSQLAIMRKGRMLFNGTQGQLLAKAAGRVWSGTVNLQRAEQLKIMAKVISSRQVAGGVELRVLADESPFAGAVQASAGLEDAYMAVMKSDLGAVH
ncbi:ABC transporter ATP-binding protein [Paenibacillaceae bacterium]|nr:ABC transporter ATP-binding protein [Paenibacillaceae bacterium]